MSGAREYFESGFDDAFGFTQSSRADRSTRHLARVRLNKMDAIRSKLAHVSLRRRVFPHGGIHRGRDQHRSSTGEVSRAEKVVGDSVRKLSDDIGGRRRNYE